MMEYDSREWMKHMRRHTASVFNALFFDQESISDDDIVSIIADVADFFSLPLPAISDKCDTFAEILLRGDADKVELSYNIEMLRRDGINNKDAFTLCFVHEMAHQVLIDYHFGLFCNERWIQELAADLTAGLYAERHSLATGKFMYALSRQRYSITHPDGALRKKIVEHGRSYVAHMSNDGVKLIQTVVKSMPAFAYTHFDTLQQDWDEALSEFERQPSKPRPKPIDIETLPDSNLIKQAVMRYRENK